MRWTGLAGCCALLLASQVLVGCGDDDPAPPGVGGSGVGGSGTAGNGGGGSDAAGSTSEAGKGGSNVGGGGSGTGGSAGGTGGAGGTGAGGGQTCTASIDCFTDDNPCTADTCVDGFCKYLPDNDATCADTNDCTDDVCEDGECKHTNNTATCNDDNECTDQDKCDGGTCKGTNNTKDCNDLNSCTPGQDKCAAGVCSGTRDTAACPACNTTDNLIKNCDFSMMLTNWVSADGDIGVEGGQASQSIVNERDIVTISQGGPNMYCVQPRQEMLTLKQGFRYKFGFVAGSDLPRDGAIALTQGYGPLYTVYSTGDSPAGGFKVALAPEMKPYNFEFLMTAPDDAMVKLEIKVGGPTATANKTYFDDVYVREVKCTDAASCDDGNACTTDTCDAVSGKCTFTALANGADCDSDDESCTPEVCEAGACVKTTLPDDELCDPDAEACTEDVCKAGVCSHVAGPTCTCTSAASCDDNNPCTTDACTTGTCTYTNAAGACNDNNACTNADTCTAGTCGGTNACYADCATGNLLMNCDFATALPPWTLYQGGGVATTAITNGALVATVTAAGTNNYDLQVLQGGVILAANKTYRIKLNASSTIARKIFVGLTHNGGAFETYASVEPDLVAGMNQITFDYTTAANWVEPTDHHKVEIRLGSAAYNPTLPNSVTIDNVSISEVTP